VVKQPLAEIFGFKFDDQSTSALRYRKNRLCPYNNRVPNCTKDKADNPLGVCSVLHNDNAVITCPIRFRQDWLIADDAAAFFFSADTKWTSLTEVRLQDKHGKSAGNIDVVLVSYDISGKLIDFGALEVQAVYISGNVRRPFEAYMQDPSANQFMDWSTELHYPSPDFLSSSRKRLAPQLLYKGGILNNWRKKTAVALDMPFYRTLPKLREVPIDSADMAFFVYDLVERSDGKGYELEKVLTIYTEFNAALHALTCSEAGSVDDFINVLQRKLDKIFVEETPPDAPTLDQIVGGP